MKRVLSETVQGRESRVRGLHPGWYASVMGTAILAVAAYRNPGDVAALRSIAHAIGVAFWAIAVLVAVVLGVPYVVRWARHRDAAVADLRHPVLGPLYGTFPGGLLVLAVATSTAGGDVLPEAAVTGLAAALTVIGAVLAFMIAVAFGYVFFTGEVPVAQVNGGWFIPPVINTIVPIAAVPLYSHVPAPAGRLLLTLGWATFGMGLLLFLFVMALLFQRLITHPLPPPPLAPSLWIALGPIGVGTIAMTNLASVSPGATASAVHAVVRLFATALWGFGLWWLAIAAILLVRYLRGTGLPYGLGWWSFTFPLGAYTVATLTLARQWQATSVEAFAAVLFLGLLVGWIVVAIYTVRAVRSGQVWQR